MARSKGDVDGASGRNVNKSAAIREVIAQNPNRTSKEVVSLLSQKGIKVRPTLVYYIKSKQRQQQRRQKRQHVAETSRNTGAVNPVELVLQVKELSRQAGGISYLKQLVDALAE
jgi:arginine repressor